MTWTAQGTGRGVAGLTERERAAFARIAAGGRTRSESILRALLRERLIYVVAVEGRRHVHLTQRGREAAERIA